MEGASSPSSDHARDSEMEVGHHAPSVHDDAPPNVWDWGDLLDFAVDADLSINWDSGPAEPPPPMEVPAESPVREVLDPGRIRKRDPRMVCSNFLAGRVPCACPEMDEKMMEMEEDEAGHGKKRARTARAQPGAARCQVPTCGADIRELKGYHRRHRVCLRCANAGTVVIEGVNKRYCQQCGKFHVSSDFDEGKRSCRRKLERHNNRRRRKPVDSKGAIEKESQGDAQSEDASGDGPDGEGGKDCSQFSSQMVQKETWVDSEAGHASPLSPLRTAPDSKDANSDGFELINSGETQVDGGKHNSRRGLSPSYYENKSAYSSVCPTGRISFKLYDWNPAEFPRRLRHQIFQWLANMPVELEGYIRPGCIILTVFVAMPRFMWMKLSEDPVSYIHNFVVAPGGMLSGRGNILVYVNNMVFQVVKGGNSVIKAKVDVGVPRLHYVHPTCFEAGKPMEFVACGSNLFQPKLRFLLSFSGKYLAYDYSSASSRFQTASNLDHQLYRIQVPHTEADCFGPVFIEVENEAGLSNFIPVLIGDKETCSEMKVIQQRLDESLLKDGPCVSPIASLSNSCDASSLRQSAITELILDVAWLLKKPGSEGFQQILTASQVQRLNRLLSLLISVESTTILERILQNMKSVMDKLKLTDECSGISDADLRLLQKYMDYAHQLSYQKLQKDGSSDLPSRNLPLKEDQCCCPDDACSDVSFLCQDTKIMVNGKLGLVASSTYSKTSETIRLLTNETFSEANLIKEWPSDASCHTASGELMSSRNNRSILRFRPTLLLIATAAVCLGICSVLFHPHKVSEFAVSIRRCLLNKI
ncbi:squamosa promoter-binding-like protein 7 [Morus notabilis]|uniref:squamosa promoter-binding-like protein 7 n=1 Tax=Morus notabilis TaxID=981085 RepID=UPI000CED6DA2|nr:squamosa promoter-binding-like protein 7 [Morus notabilis]